MSTPNPALQSTQSQLLGTQFANNPNVTADAAANLQSTINSSPVLINQLNSAVAAGHLNHFALLPVGTNAGGSYDGNGRIKVYRMTKIIRNAFYALIAITCCACTHAVKNKPSLASKQESPAMNVTDNNDTFNPSTLDEYPDLTPEEMGKRFLKLLSSIDSVDELSFERIREVTQLPLKYVSAGKVYDFSMYLPESDWTYSFTYSETPTGDAATLETSKSINLEFNNPESPEVDTAPICGKHFDAYVTELKKIGFVIGPEMIGMGSDSVHISEKNEHFIEWNIFRLSSKTGLLNLSGSIVEQRQKRSVNEISNYSCLKSIYIGGVIKE
jgi:hypothetical protein